MKKGVRAPIYRTYALILLFLIIAGGIIAYVHLKNKRIIHWQYDFNAEISTHNALPKIFRSVSIDSNRTYVSLVNGYTYNVDNDTGRILWKHEALGNSIYPAAFGDIRTKKHAYITNFDGRLYALDQETGKSSWTYKTPGYFKADTEPHIEGDLVLFASRDGVLRALNRLTGTLVWTYQTKQVDLSKFSENEAVLHFGRFTTDSHGAYINSATENAIIALSLETGKEIWRIQNYGFIFQQPTVINTSITYWNNSDIYSIAHAETGKIMFQKKASRNQVAEGTTHSYIVDDSSTIAAVNYSNGNIDWRYSAEKGSQIQRIKTVSDTVIVEEVVDNKRRIFFIEPTGRVLRTVYYDENDSKLIETFGKDIFVINSHRQCLYTLERTDDWCTSLDLTGYEIDAAYITNSEIYILLVGDSNNKIVHMNKHSGNIIWERISADININSLQTYANDIYYYTKDNLGIIKLDSNSPVKNIRDNDIQRVHILTTSPAWIIKTAYKFQAFLEYVSTLIKHTEQQNVSILPPNTVASVNIPVDFVVHFSEDSIRNKYDDAAISAEFTNGNEKIQLHGFYYDTDEWRIRFTATDPGVWKWKILVQLNGTDTNSSGTIQATESGKKEFIQVLSTNKKYFSYPGGNIYTPIGIQDCVQDYNHDGNPLNQWFIGHENEPQRNPFYSRTDGIDEYLTAYGSSGFNLFRWGAGNCSFTLWKSLSENGNNYAPLEGMMLDEFFQKLKQYDFHIWMSLFSFDLPVNKDLPLEKKKIVLSKYIDYIVARYSGVVDVWELTNEVNLDDELAIFMSKYLKSIDPYHKPITTNWDKSYLESIDFASEHWYSHECDLYCDGDLSYFSKSYAKLNKPAIFSENGNWHINWDPFSATRMRTRLWMGLFYKISFIFWNTSGGLYINGNNGTSNIYLGPVERQYIKVFSTFVRSIKPDVGQYPVHMTNTYNKAFALTSDRMILGYIYRQINYRPEVTDYLSIYIPSDAVMEWIKPDTGDVILSQKLAPGDQIILTPEFSIDIAFKVRLL